MPPKMPVKAGKSKFVDSVTLVTDGACSGNPGPGAVACLIIDDEKNELDSHGEFIGNTTNNRAEYRALIKGMQMAGGHTRRRLVCVLDSELVVKQMTSEYRLKDAQLQEHFLKVKELEKMFTEVIYQHVSRDHQLIVRVDRMVKETMQGRPPKKKR